MLFQRLYGFCIIGSCMDSNYSMWLLAISNLFLTFHGCFLTWPSLELHPSLEKMSINQKLQQRIFTLSLDSQSLTIPQTPAVLLAFYSVSYPSSLLSPELCTIEACTYVHTCVRVCVCIKFIYLTLCFKVDFSLAFASFFCH